MWNMPLSNPGLEILAYGRALCGSRNIKDRNLVPNIEEGATGEVRLFPGRKVYLSGVYKRNGEEEEMKQ